MELQGLSNSASRRVLQENATAVVSSSASLASTNCCNDSACNCAADTQGAQTLASSQSSQVQISERAQQLSRQTPSEGVNDAQNVRPLAGLSRLAQQALRAYQTEAPV